MPSSRESKKRKEKASFVVSFKSQPSEKISHEISILSRHQTVRLKKNDIIDRNFSEARTSPHISSCLIQVSFEAHSSHIRATFEPHFSLVWASFEPRLSFVRGPFEPHLSLVPASFEPRLSLIWASFEPCSSLEWDLTEKGTIGTNRFVSDFLLSSTFFDIHMFSPKKWKDSKYRFVPFFFFHWITFFILEKSFCPTHFALSLSLTLLHLLTRKGQRNSKQKATLVHLVVVVSDVIVVGNIVVLGVFCTSSLAIFF